MNPLRIAILASHGGSNMQAIIDRIAAGSLDARIVLVVSNNSASGGMERAQRAGILRRHISGVTHPGEGGVDAALAEACRAANAELIVLAGYMRPLGPQMLGAFAGRIINIHPSLLPRHGGAGMYGIHPHSAALAAGDAESGASVHVVVHEYDRGPVLKQASVAVISGDTPESLQARVLEVEHRIYSEVIAEIASGHIALPIQS